MDGASEREQEKMQKDGTRRERERERAQAVRKNGKKNHVLRHYNSAVL